MHPFDGPAQSPLPLPLPLLRQMEAVGGRLSREEADLLAASIGRVLTALPVAADFWHFAPSLVPGGYIAFHDYADYYPGVQAVIAQLLRHGAFDLVAQAGSMVVLLMRKNATVRAKPSAAPRRQARRSPVGAAVTKLLTMFNPVGAIIQAVISACKTFLFHLESPLGMP